MEITTMQMYWLVMLDKFIYTGWFLLIFFGVATFFAIGMLADDLVKKWCPITTAALSFVGLAIVTFTPNTKQMAAIMIVPKSLIARRFRQSETRCMTSQLSGWKNLNR
jgi:hypothetical protein